MVWIYGGGLIAGEANDYNASKVVTQGCGKEEPFPA
jgi:carboxylesterase type B